MAKKFTKEPGRAIYFDGIPVIYIARTGDDSAGHNIQPYEADELTGIIVRLLNRSRTAKTIGAKARKRGD